MPTWLQLLSSVAVLAGTVLLAWALAQAIVRRRAMLAPDDQGRVPGDGAAE
jgi:hypothetical protein